MGGPVTERAKLPSQDLAQRITTRLERGMMLTELRQAASTLRQEKLRIVGVAGLSFNEVDNPEDAIMRAAKGCIVASRRLPIGYRRLLNSYVFVQMGEPSPEELDYVHSAVKELTTIIPDSRFLSFIDVNSESTLVLGAVNLQTEEIYRYPVSLQTTNS